MSYTLERVRADMIDSCRQCSEFGLQAYTCPSFFSNDWLNCYLTSSAAAVPEHVGNSVTASSPTHSVSSRLAAREDAPSNRSSSQTLTGRSEGGSVIPEKMGQLGAPQVAGVGAPASKPPDCADYRFVYLGRVGSRTHVHADVLRSYSWSITVSYTHLTLPTKA